MPDSAARTRPQLDPACLLPIVVGAHHQAELEDRPLAERLRLAIIETGDAAVRSGRLIPLVITDLWYLNEQTLRLRPTIAVGRPERNAAAAFLASKVPTAFVIEEAYRIQLDPEFVETKACIWGRDHAATATAVEQFVRRYLARFIESAGLES